MKKTAAALLSLSMMASVALAANPTIGAGATIAPGSTIDITIDQFKPGTTAYLGTDTFSISTKKIGKGANLIKEIRIDDDEGVLQIVLNKNMELDEPRVPNLVIDTLSIKAKQDNGDVKRGNILTINGIEETIGHLVNEVTLTGNLDTILDGFNKITSNDSSIAYGDVLYSVGDLMLEGRAYKGDEIFVNGVQQANTEVVKGYPDADLRFIGLETAGLPSTFKVTLAAEEDEFIYKIVDNKLMDSGLEWSADDYAWTGKVRSSVDYVISDSKLKTAPINAETGEEEEEVANPDTGANDVVGVAAALAVISLAAAAAVALKK